LKARTAGGKHQSDPTDPSNLKQYEVLGK